MAFDPDWLALRFSFDASARHAFPLHTTLTTTKPHIVDLGAGLGANVRHLACALPGPQRWTLVDTDAANLDRAIPALSNWAADLGWPCHTQHTSLHIERPAGPLSITTLCASILDLHTHLDLDCVDLVTANALFDLLTRPQLDDFVAHLQAHRLPLLATLNYTGMRFDPADPTDPTWISAYEAHMTRPQPHGHSMGPSCAAQLAEALTDAGHRPDVVSSPWQISPGDDAMLNHMLDFMEGAVPQMLHGQNDALAFSQWMARRRREVSAGQVGLTVEHSDVFASP